MHLKHFGKKSQNYFYLLVILFICTIANAAPTQKSNVIPAQSASHHSLSIHNPSYIIPAPPKISAKAYYLKDANTGKVIAALNEHQRLAPASLTKLMTLYIIFKELQVGNLRLTDSVPISKLAWKTGGSKMFIKVGNVVPVNQLIQGIIVDSGNDACIAMAEYIAGSQENFVNIMNQEAKALGMRNTHFMDATGLPHPQHYMSPADLSLLANTMIHNFPQYYHWFKQKSFTYNGIKQYNRNRLLWRNSNVDGLKTGHTKEAGYCLISTAKQGDMRLISVVMKTPTDAARTKDSQQLLTYGFRYYQTIKPYSAGQKLMKARVWKGKHHYTELEPEKNIFITIPHGQYKLLKAKITIPKNLVAPLKKGEKLGTLTITLNDKTIANYPLVSSRTVAKGGLFKQLKDSIKLAFKHYLKT